MTTKFIGFDPSLRNWGYCLAYHDPQQGTLKIDRGGVIHSKPDKHPRKNLEDLQSATQLYHHLHHLVTHLQPDYLVAELPTGSQSARANTSYGVCIALSAALAYQDGQQTVPLVSVTPHEIKNTVGIKNATKDQVIAWVKQTYPEVQEWLNPLPKSKQEHICDAIVAVHTAVFQ